MHLDIDIKTSEELARVATIEIMLPALLGYVSEPDVPYQYVHTVTRFGEIEHIEEQMRLICVWANDNLEHKWYISKSSFDLNVWSENMSVEFNFVMPEDQMAFKLMWS